MSSHQDSSSVLGETADSRLTRRVEAYLFTRSYPALRELEISAADGIVTITGTVSTFHQKQVAYQSCRRVAGVLDVTDLAEVLPQEMTEGSSISSPRETSSVLVQF